MPEPLRDAFTNLLQALKTLLVSLLDATRAAGRELAERAKPIWVDIRATVEPLFEGLPGAIAKACLSLADALERFVDRIAPRDEVAVEHADEVDVEHAEEGDAEFADMLSDLGAVAPTPEQAADPTLAETTIVALSENLHGLRDLGDQLARAEQDKLALAARVRELEAGLGDTHTPDAQVERLENALRQREETLERTRERVGDQRSKTESWKRKAAERWHEIRSLRSQVKQLERALADAQGKGEPAGALPKRASGSRAKRRGARTK